MSNCAVNQHGEEIRNAVTPITRAQKTPRHFSARTNQSVTNLATSSFQPIVPRACIAADNGFVAILPQAYNFQSVVPLEADASTNNFHSQNHVYSSGTQLAALGTKIDREELTETTAKRARRSATNPVINLSHQSSSLQFIGDELDDAETSFNDGIGKTEDDGESQGNGSGTVDKGRPKGGRNEVKRRSHSEIERKRRSRINGSIESLARLVITYNHLARDTNPSVVPGYTRKPFQEEDEASLQRVIAKWSKVDVLAKAYDLLERLAHENEEMHASADNLRSENERLRALLGARADSSANIENNSSGVRSFK